MITKEQILSGCDVWRVEGSRAWRSNLTKDLLVHLFTTDSEDIKDLMLLYFPCEYEARMEALECALNDI